MKRQSRSRSSRQKAYLTSTLRTRPHSSHSSSHTLLDLHHAPFAMLSFLCSFVISTKYPHFTRAPLHLNAGKCPLPLHTDCIRDLEQGSHSDFLKKKKSDLSSWLASPPPLYIHLPSPVSHSIPLFYPNQSWNEVRLERSLVVLSNISKQCVPKHLLLHSRIQPSSIKRGSPQSIHEELAPFTALRYKSRHSQFLCCLTPLHLEMAEPSENKVERSSGGPRASKKEPQVEDSVNQ